MDRRQRRTRKAIFGAFTKLLERKPYGGITVQEIIDEADIGRSTFYAHFATKDELLDALCTEIFDHVFSDDLMEERTHDFSHDSDDMAHKVTHILYHLRDSESYLRPMLRNGSGSLFMGCFKDHLRRVFADAMSVDEPGIPRDYLVNHMVCDFAESVRWWMDHDEYSPEEIAGFFMGTTPYLS